MPCVRGGTPKFMERVTFIKNYALDTCSQPWRIYLETGGRAVGNLAMALLFIDTADLARSFFRPKKSRSGRHSNPFLGRGKKRTKRGLFPEPSDLIADTVRSATGLQKFKYSDGFNHMWTVDTHLQKILHKVVFVNLVNDFAYDWFSGIILAPESKCNIGRFQAIYENHLTVGEGFQIPTRLGLPQFQTGAICWEHEVELFEGLWAIDMECQVDLFPPDTQAEVIWGCFVGEEEKMKVCGKLVEIESTVQTPILSGNWRIVRGPDFLRGMGNLQSITPSGGELENVLHIMRGFRID
jgi:hypothetical protein